MKTKRVKSLKMVKSKPKRNQRKQSVIGKTDTVKPVGKCDIVDVGVKRKGQERAKAQCVGRIKGVGTNKESGFNDFEFSFRPHYRIPHLQLPSDSDSDSYDDSDTDDHYMKASPKSMYLSRRMSIKLTDPRLSPLRSPIIARRLQFTPEGTLKKSKHKEIKLIKKYKKKRRRT